MMRRPIRPSMRTGLAVPVAGAEGAAGAEDVPAGGFLEVLATDPGAVKDFEHFCKTTGCELLDVARRARRGAAFPAEKAGSDSRLCIPHFLPADD